MKKINCYRLISYGVVIITSMAFALYIILSIISKYDLDPETINITHLISSGIFSVLSCCVFCGLLLFTMSLLGTGLSDLSVIVVKVSIYFSICCAFVAMSLFLTINVGYSLHIEITEFFQYINRNIFMSFIASVIVISYLIAISHTGKDRRINGN